MGARRLPGGGRLLSNFGRPLEQWTTILGVVILSNVKAEPLLRERQVLAENAFVEMVV
jgi:hypothetical protein